MPEGIDIQVKIQHKNEPMCCYGCQAVAQSIVNSGMDDFYKFRTENPNKAKEIVPEFLQHLKVYDNPAVQKHFVSENGDVREVSLILEGIVCAACIWLNENHLNALPGVINATINYTNNRARVRWDNHQISLSEILESISRIGYLAHPYDPDKQQQLIEKERKQQLHRIGLAGILGMQVMILAVAMYTGEWWGIDDSFKQSFRWLSLVITVPILLYASRPFFTAAFRDLKNFRVGMDVPVALGIGIAFTASVANTISNSGEIYFDSVSMFTFFLLGARYFEMSARKRTAESTEALLNLRPAIATKLIDENGTDKQLSVPVAELVVGDRVLVRPGENIPADGTIINGTSGINESLITGESLPITKTKDDAVIGGSTNTESPLIIKIDKLGDDTVLASIHRLLNDAQHNKPAMAKVADQLASKFVAVILLIATGVAFFWYQYDAQQWIAITIATLVVTCPCALSLATPTAITAASGQLVKLGLLPTSSLALETLAKTTDFVFDKTGTLTQGNIKLVATIPLDTGNKEQYIKIAAALESASEHPIAKSIIQVAHEIEQDETHPEKIEYKSSNVINTPGSGISGRINHTQWYIGNLNYIQSVCKTPIPKSQLENAHLKDLTVIALATDEKTHALFAFDDELRDKAKELVRHLQKAGKTVTLMTGDNKAAATRVATAIGIKNVFADLKPADKLEKVRDMQRHGAIVAMTGDGINDAPVLAGADISIAMGSGTQLAATQADMILLSNHIENLYSGYRVATGTMTIIRQNLTWAFSYNLLAVPAAAMGYVDPWMAAIGMSASSLIVVLNALRLTRLQ